MAKDMSKMNYEGLPDEQIEVVMKLFDKYDLDRDCRLNQAEFRKVLVAVGLRDVDAKAVYSKCDADNNGMVDVREFIKWLYKSSPDFDTDKGDLAKERMGKVHKHMQRTSMTKDEAMEDFFEFMGALKEEYKFASKRECVVLEKDLRESASGKVEKNRDVKLRDFFNCMDLNGNGKLSMQEFIGGLAAFGHTGDHAMMANIFRAIDQEKKKTRVWDRNYHSLKAQEEAQAAVGTTVYLVPACEIFEKRDMRKWNEDRAEAIAEAMDTDSEAMQEALRLRKEKVVEQKEKVKEISKLEDTINAKKSANPAEDQADNDMLRDLNKELTEIEKAIDSQTAIQNQGRFHYTETKHKDGVLDWNEFKKMMESFEAPK